MGYQVEEETYHGNEIGPKGYKKNCSYASHMGRFEAISTQIGL